MSTSTLITANQFADMSFDVPVELIHGEVIAMTNPGGWHGAVCLNIAGVLFRWISQGAEYRAASNDPGVLTERDPDTVRGPDLLVIQRARLIDGRMPRKYFTVPPDVAIEVKSPNDRWPEILEKVSQFLRAGVSEVWVVDPDHTRVHAYRIDDEPTVFSRGDRLVSAFLPGFDCAVEELFQGIDFLQ
ncbi:Uma2 family endonuclease [Planctomicrobium sp. SH664]|uniref:Uma2 family endonuclease n=1 Tax=Planctomicrobium sp. SH664 TaxID=3448125 RepID=UPI003F5B6FB6